VPFLDPVTPFGSRNASEDAKLFYGQAIKERCIAAATELFYDEAWAEKSEQNLSRLAGSDVVVLPNGLSINSGNHTRSSTTCCGPIPSDAAALVLRHPQRPRTVTRGAVHRL